MMFNVLPDILKEEIKIEYRSRRLIVILLFVLLVQISFLVLLFPSWLISRYKEQEMLGQSNSQKSSITSKNADSIMQTISDTNSGIGAINTTFKYEKVAPLWNEIIAARSKSVSLLQLTYVSTGPSSATLSVRGISATREALVSFVKKLGDSKTFLNVDSPISNLAKDKDIDFTVNLDATQ